MMIALAALKKWHIQGLDIRTTFLYGELNEELYMEQPEGFKVKGKEGKVMHLKHAIYRLKQAALAWWKALNKSMAQLGFTLLLSDSGIFVNKDKSIVTIVYLDNVLFLGPNKKDLLCVKEEFMKKLECRDLGEAKEFLHMHIQHKIGKIYLDQTAYLQTVLQCFKLQNTNPVHTLLPKGYQPSPNMSPTDPSLCSQFQQVIGLLLYIMLGTCPDIAFAVTKLSQHATNPSEDHLSRALYICHYLLGTLDYALVYDGPSNSGLEAYANSDWASDLNTRKFTTGYLMKLAGGIFAWNSHAQKIVALLSTEAEYMLLSDTSQQLVWVKNLLIELDIQLSPILLYGDNQGSIFLASNLVQEKHIKHIDLCYHYIRDVVHLKQVELFFIEGAENPTDMFTKNLGHVNLLKFREQLGLEFYSST
jgi:Reverse transcriptase (RNA-dependent DNA polymerase)